MAQPEPIALPIGEALSGVVREAAPLVETEALGAYGTPTRGLAHRLRVPRPGTYRIELHSHLFDAYLVLRDPAGAVLAEDDDGLLGTHSRIIFTAESADQEYIVEACALHGDRGEYTIEVREGAPPQLTRDERREAELQDALQGVDHIRSTLGQDDLRYAQILNQLGQLYLRRGEYQQSKEVFIESAGRYREVVGADHPSYAEALSNLGTAHLRLAEYEEAESSLLQALGIQRAALGERHLSTATTMNVLAVAYELMGQLERAEKLLLEVLDIRSAVLGEKNRSTAISLNNLAMLYQAMGDYRKAEPLLLRSLDVRREVLGERHPDTSTVLNNLGLLYYTMGAFQKAEPLFQEAIEIRAEALGEDHPRTVTAVSNLALLYSATGQYEDSERLYLETREQIRNRYGEDHPTYAISLNSLGHLYARVGSLEAAEPLLLEAARIRREVLGDLHPDLARTLANLGSLYLAMERPEAAGAFFVESEAIRREVIGERHPEYAVSLGNLAAYHAALGEYATAVDFHARAVEVTQTYLEDAAVILTEERQLAMRAAREGIFHQYLDTASRVPEAVPQAFAAELAWKGSILVRQRSYREVAGEPEIADVFGQLQAVSRRLATTMRANPRGAEIAAWRQRQRRTMEVLTAEKERLTRDLVAQSAAFRRARARVTAREVVDALPDESALVDYVALRDRMGQSPEKLVAFVVTPDGAISLHDLGRLEPIEAAILGWRRGGFGRSGGARQAARSLRSLLWDPLAGRLDGRDLVLVSPDGELGQFPLAALPGGRDGAYLLEEHRLALVPVPQLLPRLLEKSPQNPGPQLLVMGDVDYDAGAPAASGREPGARGVDPSRPQANFNSDIRAGTQAEITAIERMFRAARGGPIVRLQASDATENRFRQHAPGSAYIHLATHGFFAPRVADPSRPDPLFGQSLGRELRAPLRAASPYLLSGLAFAGANRPPQPDQDDGVLTAEEIAFLPLGQAELVCLSACETGLGEVAGGEGMLSLQRAFQISGARATIASLWKVPDRATRRLMERFYTNLWEQGLSKLDALRDAQLWLLRHPDPASGAPDGARAGPEIWAAFQISGDWR